jgi:phage terminase large subunit GpA-like protein
MAAEFIRADGDIAAAMNFRNSRLAEPFEVQVSRREPSKIRQKSEEAEKRGHAGAERVVPDWAVMLIATVDVQKDHCYWQVDAWGYELKSKRVAVGVAASLEEAHRQVFSPDVPLVSQQGGAVHVSEMIVDSGFRKDEVTAFALRDPRRVHLAKGLSHYFGPIAEPKAERASGVIVWNINTMQSKDTLDRLIGDQDPDRWQVFAGIGDDYCTQLCSEQKVLNPQKRIFEWQLKTSGAHNHYWDCSAMSCAVASARGAAMPKPAETTPVRSTENIATFGGSKRW